MCGSPCERSHALVGDVAAGTGNLSYDVNGDGFVNLGDVNHWVQFLKGTLLGDANLDFSVDGSDFGVWNAAKFTSDARWCAADWPLVWAGPSAPVARFKNSGRIFSG